MTFTEMLTVYFALTAAHYYNLGFIHHHVLYSIFIDWETLKTFCKEDRASTARGGHTKIRIRLHKADRIKLIAQGAQAIGTEKDLREMEAYNQGDNYERIIVETFTAGTWKKNSTPFWVAGDAEINGQQVQIKLEGAELTNEKALAKALRTA